MNDRRQKLEEDSKRLSAELYRFGDLSRQKHGMRDNVNQRLKQVENSITFRLFDQDSIDEQPETYAYVMINRNLEAIELGPSGWDPGYPSDVFLGTGAILQINKQKERIARIIRSSKRKILKTEKYERHLSRLLRLQLVLAITLCHEMMHVISNGMMPPSSNSTVEPYYCDDRLNELGFAYENCVFGGTVQDLEFRGCKRPLTITKWPAFDSADVNTSIYELRKPRRFATMYFISMQFVSNVQQQAFWDRRCATHDTILLQIPRTIGWRAKYLEEGDPNWASQDSSNMRLSVNTLGQVFRMKSA